MLIDLPVLVAPKDNYWAALLSENVSSRWIQLFADKNNAGTIYMGGETIAVDRGIPIYPGGSLLVSPSGALVYLKQVCLFFTKSGDRLFSAYLLDV